MRMSLELPFWATLSLAAGPLFFARGFRALRTHRLIRDTPTARIRSMAMGRVEVNGVVLARSTVTAPFSGRPCAYWEVDISTQVRKRGWSVVHRNASGSPFYLRDDTGTALVYPRGAECRVSFGIQEECVGLTLPECYAKYMADQKISMRHFLRLGVLRFRERWLEEGQAVYVLGHAQPRAQSISISDAELAATGTDSYRAGRIHERDEEIRGVIRRGEHDRTFIISQQSELQMSIDFGMRAMGQLVGGPILTLFGLGYWLSVFASRARPH